MFELGLQYDPQRNDGVLWIYGTGRAEKVELTMQQVHRLLIFFEESNKNEMEEQNGQ